MEQTDSDQRGGVVDNRGKNGKGHQGTCIKDPWTKTNISHDTIKVLEEYMVKKVSDNPLSNIFANI